jgi:hypothetical protein
LEKKPIFTLCDKDHETQQCPSLPGIKEALQPTDEEVEAVYLLTQRRQWKPRGQGMNPNMPFTSSNHWNNYPSFSQENYPPFNQMKYPPLNQMNYPPMQQTNPPFVDPTIWTPWPSQQQPYLNQWNPNWRGQQPPFPNQFPQFQSEFQQPLPLPSGAPPNNQMMWPQLPIQPKPNPNNKVVQCIDIQN